MLNTVWGLAGWHCKTHTVFCELYLQIIFLILFLKIIFQWRFAIYISFAILYLSIPRLLRLLLLLYWFLRPDRCCLYQNGTDNANEMTYSGLYSMFAMILIWNCPWMYFYICLKYITVLVTSFNLPSSYRDTDKFIMNNFKWTELVKRFISLNWERVP